MRPILALLCAILLWHGEPARAADPDAGSQSPIAKEWLERQISVKDAEAGYPVINGNQLDSAPAALTLPLNTQKRKWEALKAGIKPGDEIWTFAAPADYWAHLAGRAGYAVVRDGKPISVVVTVEN
jgi:hypothetical protein